MKKIETKWLVFIWGALIGFITFGIVYGYKVLDVTYDAWIINNGGDMSQHYLGWVYYRKSPWHFPIGLTDGIIYPNKVSVIFMDSIPIMALLFKIISPILPSTFQYFGIFGLLTYMLQGGMAAVLIYSKTENKKISIIGSIFFVCSSVLLMRIFIHTALGFHPIILISIYVFLNKQEFYEKHKDVQAWTILLVMASMIHIYFVPMVAVFIFGFYFYELFSKEYLKTIVKIMIPIVITIVIMYIMGYFYGNGELSDGGLGLYNCNINSLFNDQSTSFIATLLNRTSTGIGEGYAYLGYGIILLSLICVISICQKQEWRKFKSKYIPIIIVTMLFLILSIEPNVKIGDFTILKIKYPQKIYNLLSIFRSNGRFMWPVFYMIMLGVIVYVGNNYRSCGWYIVTAILIIQIIDLSPVFASRKNIIQQGEDAMESEVWENITANELFFFYEPVQTTKLLQKTMRLGKYAADNNMVMNDFYVARKNNNELDTQRIEEMNQLLQGDVDANKLYIFSTIPTALISSSNINIYIIDDIIIGSKKEIKGAMPVNIDDGIELLNMDSYNVSEGEETEDGKIIKKNGILYGPYIDLTKGDYSIIIKGENLNKGRYDIVNEKGENIIPMEVKKKNDEEMIVYFSIDKLENEIEIRCFNESKASILVSNVILGKH